MLFKKDKVRGNRGKGKNAFSETLKNEFIAAAVFELTGESDRRNDLVQYDV